MRWIKMDKCPRELCEHWNESDGRCSLREYEYSDYGTFLRGYRCILDMGLKDRCVLKKKAKYKVGDYVFYIDSTNIDKYKTIEEAVLRVRIDTVEYWSPAHQAHYDIGVPSGVNGFTSRNEDKLFKTKKECIKKHKKSFNGYREATKKYLEEKQKEIEHKMERYS